MVPDAVKGVQKGRENAKRRGAGSADEETRMSPVFNLKAILLRYITSVGMYHKNHPSMGKA